MPRPKMHHKTKRRARQIPFGYRVSDYDEDLLEPIPEIVEILDVAERAWLARTASQEDITRFVIDRCRKAGFNVWITKAGLKKRLFTTQKNIKKHAIRTNAKTLKAHTA
jgi:hypothetical protein